MATVASGRLLERPRRIIVKRVRQALRKAREDGDWRSLARMYRFWLLFRPNDRAAWARLAQARGEIGKAGPAARAYERARDRGRDIAVDGDDFGKALHLAAIAKAAGRNDEAVERFDKLLRQRPSDPEPFKQLKALGHRERALSIARENEKSEPGKPGPNGHGGLAIFTIVSNNYMPQARALMEGVRRHYPGSALFVCLGDRALDRRVDAPHDTEILLAAEIGVPAFEHFAFRYGPTEFHTALKPFVFRYLLRERGFGQAIYFDPDILVFAPSEGVLAKLRTGASIVVTPHLSRPVASRPGPNELAILRAGVFNLGFLAANASEEALGFIDWWAERLQFDCRNEPHEGVFVDQKFMDLLPCYAPNFAVERSPGANLAYWNLVEHQLTARNGGFDVDGTPLEFFHFSGFQVSESRRLSKHSREYSAVAAGPLGDLLDLYRGLLLENGHEIANDIPLSFGASAEGSPIPWLARRFFRETYAWWPGDPFVNFREGILRPVPFADGKGSAPAFLAYLSESEGELRSIFNGPWRERHDKIARWLRSNANRLDLPRGFVDALVAALQA